MSRVCKRLSFFEFWRKREWPQAAFLLSSPLVKSRKKQYNTILGSVSVDTPESKEAQVA